MKFLDIFPTTIFLEEINNLNLESYQEHVKNLNLNSSEKSGSYTTSSNILENSLFQKLKYVILNRSSTYIDELGFNYESLQISNSWGNILNKNEIIPRHSHANSYVSGCFYLTEGSPIQFYNPLHQKYTFSATSKDNVGFRGLKDYKITPKKGMLIIFPSWIDHTALPSETNNRISIAFNIIPKGNFGWNTAQINL